MGDVLIKFRYEERDIANALRLQMTSALRRRPEVLLALFVCIAGCVTSYVLAPGFVRVIVVGVTGAIVLLVASVLVILPRVTFRREATLRLPMTVDASDEGLTVVKGAHAVTIAWRDCARVESDRRICVIRHGDEVVLVPRRAFRDAGREKAFFALLSTRAGKSDDSTPGSPPRAQTS